MMKKKLVTFLMALSLFATSIMPSTVFAGPLQNVGDTDSQNVTASFTVDASDLGGVTVSIPATIDLAFDSGTNSYKTDGQDKVYAYGYLNATNKIEISTATTADFVNGTTNHLEGNVTFGTLGKQEWSSAELLAGQNNSNAIKKETLNVVVDDLTGIVMGEYEATLTFNVETKTA